MSDIKEQLPYKTGQGFFHITEEDEDGYIVKLEEKKKLTIRRIDKPKKGSVIQTTTYTRILKD